MQTPMTMKDRALGRRRSMSRKGGFTPLFIPSCVMWSVGDDAVVTSDPDIDSVPNRVSTGPGWTLVGATKPTTIQG